MIQASLKHKSRRVTIHTMPRCHEALALRQLADRELRIVVANLSEELQNFVAGNYSLQGEDGLQDLWIAIDCEHLELEIAILSFIEDVLALSDKSLKKRGHPIHCLGPRWEKPRKPEPA